MRDDQVGYLLRSSALCSTVTDDLLLAPDNGTVVTLRPDGSVVSTWKLDGAIARQDTGVTLGPPN
jgi:hypothetical protein